jgi:hypothetical protein
MYYLYYWYNKLTDIPDKIVLFRTQQEAYETIRNYMLNGTYFEVGFIYCS